MSLWTSLVALVAALGASLVFASEEHFTGWLLCVAVEIICIVYLARSHCE